MRRSTGLYLKTQLGLARDLYLETAEKDVTKYYTIGLPKTQPCANSKPITHLTPRYGVDMDIIYVYMRVHVRVYTCMCTYT